MTTPILIVTVNMKTGLEHDRREIDNDNYSDRIWLAKHTRWALSNNHGLTMNPVMS